MLPKLIPDWRLAWRFLSVQAAVLLALLSAVQAEVLPLLSPLFPDHLWPWVSGSLALAVVLLRLVVQPALEVPRADALRQEMEVALQPPEQPMPAGRLETYIGAATAAAVLLLILVGIVLWRVL